MAGKMYKAPVAKVAPKMSMSKAPVAKAWKPQKGIPDQMKVKAPGAGWGGEKPSKKK